MSASYAENASRTVDCFKLFETLIWVMMELNIFFVLHRISIGSDMIISHGPGEEGSSSGSEYYNPGSTHYYPLHF